MSNLTETQAIAKKLITYPSLTPEDAGCQRYIAEYLTGLGFKCQHIPSDNISNLFATYGEGEPHLAFAGHTDVVPTGKPERWRFPPFAGQIADNYLHGRGAADMKGAVAAMLVMCKTLVSQKLINGRLSLLITSAEESMVSDFGTPLILDYMAEQDLALDYCIVGEPTSGKQLGDTIKVGRRGSITAYITVHGHQGHVAYPHLATNPIHQVLAALDVLQKKTWDEGNAHFPPTSLQITHIQSGTGANNVIPGDCEIVFNLRYSPEISAETIQQEVQEIFASHHISFDIEWKHSGLPYYTASGELTNVIEKVIQDQCGLTPICSTTGGTSDGRYIAQFCTQVVELGVLNETIHKCNECVSLNDLEGLKELYVGIAKAIYSA